MIGTKIASGLRGVARRLFRGTAHETASPGSSVSRRELLGAVGSLPAAGALLYPFSQASARTSIEIGPDPAREAVPESYLREYARLKALDLEDPQVAARGKGMPAARIGDLTIGRVISGSNLISPNMHARDLRYVNTLASRYNTEQRIFMTLKRCEELGIDAVVLKSHCFRQCRLSMYWDEWKGKMTWIADVITTEIEKFERLLVEHLELGASAAYVWGGASDVWYHQGKPGHIVKAFEMIRKYKIPAGIAAHRLEPIRFCEKEGLRPDFYMKTLHHDRYWSAHPKENRTFLEMYEEESEDHARYHDNLFCSDAEETVAFMRDVKVPWIAFKVLAAGAIPAKEGLAYAFENGADFVCLGMFDFQIQEDVEHAKTAIAGAKDRRRPWIG
ncbi:MAG: hypothetical protein JXP34_28810 [Planctomycetes bacterium]|nr:hypothetical protein [Planctomycetota bacterium]